MKFLCLGYFDSQMMGARSEAENDALMRECRPHMDALFKTGNVIVDAGLELESTCLRRVNGKVQVTNGPLTEGAQRIGSALLIEARDIEEAIRIASLHPATQVPAGEQSGWAPEIRPIHFFEMNAPKSVA